MNILYLCIFFSLFIFVVNKNISYFTEYDEFAFSVYYLRKSEYKIFIIY